MDKNRELFAGYIPVIHSGYIEAFNRHPDAEIGILGDDVLSQVSYLHKDIRALNPHDAEKAIVGLGRDASIIGINALSKVLYSQTVIMPDDDITRLLLEQYPQADIQKEPVFLRWDRDNSTNISDITPDRTVSLNDHDPLINLLGYEATQSSNWWRHVGAVILDDEKVLTSGHNSSLPTQYTSWIEGDPRITAKKGESIERSIDIHAEAKLIAEASKKSIDLSETSIIVSTFPCPNCAKLIALSGIKAVYYIDGYSMLDGYSVLKNFNVEIIKIEANLKPENKNSFVQY